MFKKTVNYLTEFSIPLISGVLTALVIANIDYEAYHHLIDAPLFGENAKVFGFSLKFLSFHWLINDIFMVFFFGIAAVEITQAVLPGGSLNPVSRAASPLMGTIGGVVGPVGVYFLLAYIFDVEKEVYGGWGIPTATDIALAWLVARMVFGNRHPAVSFLLLLAVADDAIGLGIIAIFYPDPNNPVEIVWLLLTLLGMLSALGLRTMKVKNMWLYVIIGGGLAWAGLIRAHLHPALALVFIVPFMPTSKTQHEGLFDDEHDDHSTLADFEHTFKLFVDFGLFGFGLANAGVQLSGINEVTWIVLGALLIGKTVGISGFTLIGQAIGFKMPNGMNVRSLILAALIAGLGLTVALFVAGVAFTDPGLQGAAKMGALFSAGAGLIAIVLGRIFRIERVDEDHSGGD